MRSSPLRLLLDFDEQVRRDRDQPPAFLHRRDRRFALDCQAQGVPADAAHWLAWIAQRSGPGWATPGSDRLLSRWRAATGGFALAGGVAGIVTMAGLLAFDGGQRINVTLLLALALLQLLLAVLTLVQSLAGWQPWRPLVRRLLPAPDHSAAARLLPTFTARAAQAGGSAFALTSLMTLLVLVVVQDLAFGWSTTLATGAGAYHRLVLAVASPWAGLWPDAVPSLALVEHTRFFRAGPESAGNPALWGQWWPFVVMTWTVWVLLPRLVLTLAAQAVLRTRARRELARHPGQQALAYRMETPILDTGNAHNDASDLPDTRTRVEPVPLPETHHLIAWAGADQPALPAMLQTPGPVYRAGGQSALAEDDAVIAALGESLARDVRPEVLMAVRSWEPPTGELQDFLEAARSRWPEATTVTLAPVTGAADQAPEQRHLDAWLRFTTRLPAGFARVGQWPAAGGPHHG